MGRKLLWAWFVELFLALTWAAAAVPVGTATGRQGVVVAGHPEATAIGVAVLQAGGNAVDAAVATSLALGVAEPYGSGLGGKLMLLYFDAKSRQTFALEAMDACGTALDLPAYRKLGDDAPRYGFAAVCVPGLPAGLVEAHRRWGARKWADNVLPAIKLARAGFLVSPKSRELFAEQENKLRRGDPEIARWYLPKGQLPEAGSRLANEDLARTMERLAAHSRDGFYRGAVAEAIVNANRQAGGALRSEDFANYEVRVVEPIGMDFRGFRLLSAPPPTIGAALYLPALKVLENEDFGGGALRTARNLDLAARVWGAVSTRVWAEVADVPAARANVERILQPESIAVLRARALAVPATGKKAAWFGEAEKFENPFAATTHFVVADAAGNIVCATQSQSLHFGAGVIAPGTGVVLNNSMSNFNYEDPANVAYATAGRRPRSTIGPTLVLREGRPVIAIGIPGASRIPTALFQVLLDRLALSRPLGDAIGDTRIHFATGARRDGVDAIEAERSLPESEATALQGRGWKVVLPEAAGTGRHFGGITAIEFNSDGTMTGYADTRRTNHAGGY